MSSPESFLVFFTLNALCCPFICNYLIVWVRNSCLHYVKLKEEENQGHCWDAWDLWLTPQDFGYHRNTWRKAALNFICLLLAISFGTEWYGLFYHPILLTDPVLCTCEPQFKNKSVFYCGMMKLCRSCLVRRSFLNHAGTLFHRGIADMARTRVNNYVSVCGLSSWGITWAVRQMTRGRQFE